MDSYWAHFWTRRHSRRTVLGGAAATAALALAACKGQSGGIASRASGTPGASGTPRTGGTFNWYLNGNPSSLDPQKSSQAAQAAVTGVYSRIFAFKTGTDPAVTVNHE